MRTVELESFLGAAKPGPGPTASLPEAGPVGLPRIAYRRAPKNQLNIRILQTMISGIPHILGLRTRM